MNPLAYLDAAFCVRLIATFAHFLWQGAAIGLVVSGGALLLRGATARLRYALHAAALLLMATAPIATYSVLITQAQSPVVEAAPRRAEKDALRPPEAFAFPESAPVVSIDSDPATADTPKPVLQSPQPATARATTPTSFDWQRYAPHACAVYLVGVLSVLGRLLLGLQGGRRLRRRAQAVYDPAVLAALARGARALGLAFTPAIAYCHRVVVPTVVGVVRPMILLPLALAGGLSPEQIEMLLLHELAHIRRYDHLVNIAQRLVEALLFFHPAVWYVSHRIRVERENCCDDLVVAAGGRPLAYASSLVEMAALSQQRSLPPAAGAVLCASGRPSQLRRRVARLLGDPTQRRVRLTRGWVLLMVVVVGALVAATHFGGSEESTAQTIDPAIEQRLNRAMGYAAVWNWEKAEAICDAVLAETDDPDVEARAHWVKAVAYGAFNLEYRTERLKDKFEAEKAVLQRLKLDLLGDTIARWEAVVPFYLADDRNVPAVLDQVRRAILRSESKAEPAPLIKEDQLSKAANIFKLGNAYWTAGALTSGTLENGSQEYYTRARDLLRRAMESRPDRYEYGTYYAALVFDAWNKQDGLRIAKQLLDRFDGRLPYPPLNDRGPFCQYTEMLKRFDKKKAQRLVQERAKTALANARVHYGIAMYQTGRATTITEVVGIWEDLVQRMEKGHIDTRGTCLQAFTSAYYRLAHFKARQGNEDRKRLIPLWRETLDTYNKLAVISPHYAEIHLNKGKCLRVLADAEKDEQKRMAFLERASREFELQTHYNWHGKSLEKAQEYLEQTDQYLEQLIRMKAVRLLGVLSMRWNEAKAREQELDDAIAGLAAIGDAAIGPIMEQFNRSGQTFAFRHRAVRVFEAMATPQAREVLLDIALGKTEVSRPPSLLQWASRAYVATLEDKGDARNLLASDVGGILNNALLALKGQIVDEAMLERLEELVHLSGGEPNLDATLRRCAADVMADDPATTFAAAKVAAIAGALGDVETMPKARDVVRMSYFTQAELMYLHYIQALGRMRGADEALRATTDRTTGTARMCLLIARAKCGDRVVRNEIRAILQDPNAGMFRAWAARGLGRIGTRDDLPLLRRLAESDPLARDSGSDVGPPGTQPKIHPVRAAARDAIETIEGSDAPAPDAAMTRMEERITIEVKDASLREFLKTLTYVTGIKFAIVHGADLKIAAKFEDKTLREILDTVLPPCGLKWKREGDTVRVFTEVVTREFKVDADTLEYLDRQQNVAELRRLLGNFKEPFVSPIEIDKEQSIVRTTDTLINVMKMKRFLDELRESGPPNLITRVYSFPSTRKAAAKKFKIIARAILFAEDAAHPQLRNQKKTILAAHERGADLIVKAPEADLRRVEKLIGDEEFVRRLEGGELDVYTVNLTPRDVIDPHVEYVETFGRDVKEVIETMLYHKTGIEAAHKEGRYLWYDAVTLQLTVVDTPENIRKIRQFIESRPELQLKVRSKIVPYENLSTKIVFVVSPSGGRKKPTEVGTTNSCGFS